MLDYSGRGARLGRPPQYRLYIDEVGNADLKSASHPHHRYLSLSGLAFERKYVASTLHPQLTALLERFFEVDPDDRVVLHRKDIMNRRGPFIALKDLRLRADFDQALHEMLSGLEFTWWTVVLDKLEYRLETRNPLGEPYLACLTVLVERYVRWLQQRSSLGDVMAESRSAKQNQPLMDGFRTMMDSGSRYLTAAEFQSSLTSLELKVRDKNCGIAGLQIADVIASAGYRFVRELKDGGELLPHYDRQLMKALETKYDQSTEGALWGWGVKFLP